MKLVFSTRAWDDYLYWQKTDHRVVQRINALILDIRRDPFKGIGKPEPLKNALSGYWSRRIDGEHRMLYEITDEGLLLVQLRYHY